jgi:CRISPR-associated endonuclease/helicase Cas3
MAPIYAKSAPRETLREHTFNCLSVLRSLREALPHLPQVAGQPDLWQHLFYAVYLHDLGKAATGFQAMLDGGEKWDYRHEILSTGFVPFLDLPNEMAARVVRLAIITHHRTTDDLSGKGSRRGYRTVGPGSSEAQAEWMQKRDELLPHWEFCREWLREMPVVARWMLGIDLPAPRLPESPGDIEDAFRACVPWASERRNRKLLRTPYATLLRGLVVACDHLASGGQPQILKLDSLANLGGIKPRPFQQAVGQHVGHALLVAPTGSGKTEAALLWAARQQDAGRRLFYVLPYTASINAMLHRFQERNSMGESVGALHGKAAYFGYQDLCERDDAPPDPAREAKRTLQLSRKIYRPVKILTPFQIIKAFFGVKGWEMQMSEFAGGLFVFDEIHVYDPRTTALLLTALERLRDMDARFLFMSATFPPFLKEKLRCLLDNELTELAPDESDPYDHALLHEPRHKVVRLPGGIHKYLEVIREQLQSGKSVLVVCNTVAPAQEVFKALRGEFEDTEKAALLHGRFILRDREAIERRLGEVQLLVGTQAVEVSLDLDFDTIFTEPAPVDALIQRFGRVNRKREKGVVPVHICEEGGDNDRFLYDMERVARTLQVLEDGLLLSEAEVTRAVEAVYGGGYNGKEQVIFDEACAAFSDVADTLTPFEASERDEEFYDLIKSVQVVPRQFENDFREALDHRQFFEAMKFQATITLGQSVKLQRIEAIAARVHHVGRKNFRYQLADLDYDPQLGLLLDSTPGRSVFFTD